LNSTVLVWSTEREMVSCVIGGSCQFDLAVVVCGGLSTLVWTVEGTKKGALAPGSLREHGC
jgi:hypothetical protein